MKAFLVTYSENNQYKSIRVECADLNTAKTWFNQWRVKTNWKIVAVAIDDLG